MDTNIVLIGFMGSGKSSVGRRLANRLKREFLDSDELTSVRAGKTISEIFETEGEERFRELETEELQRLADSSGIVLATGGGSILRKQNRELLRTIGTVLWLHADPEILFERATRNRKRPLLEVENPRGTFRSLLESRMPLYRETASLTVEASGLSHEQTVERIIRALQAPDVSPGTV
jgi:shikimate kinase